MYCKYILSLLLACSFSEWSFDEQKFTFWWLALFAPYETFLPQCHEDLSPMFTFESAIISVSFYMQVYGIFWNNFSVKVMGESSFLSIMDIPLF